MSFREKAVFFQLLSSLVKSFKTFEVYRCFFIQ